MICCSNTAIKQAKFIRTIGVVLSIAMCSSAASANGGREFEYAHELASAHDFKGAAVVLSEILHKHPQHGPAWLKLASVSLVQGKSDVACHACQQAAGLVDPIAAMACYGRITLAAGDGSDHERLVRLLDSPLYNDRNDIHTQWAVAVAAELAVAANRSALADRLFRRALAGGGWTDQVLVAYSDHLNRTRRYDAVLDLIDEYESNVSLRLRRLIALQSLGRSHELGGQLTELDDSFRRSLAAADYLHAREFAVFYLDIKPEPELALLAARENLKNQREPEDMLLFQRALAGSRR